LEPGQNGSDPLQALYYPKNIERKVAFTVQEAEQLLLKEDPISKLTEPKSQIEEIGADVKKKK